MEDRTGVLARGYYADIAVFDAELTTVDPLRLPTVKTLHTFIDGKQRYTAGM